MKSEQQYVTMRDVARALGKEEEFLRSLAMVALLAGQPERYFEWLEEMK